MTSKELAIKIAKYADDKKANDVLILNVEGLSPVTDYFVIASAGNNILTRSIVDNIEDELAKEGVTPLHKEGYADGRWVLLDYGDAVAHIFLEEERDFYNLEQLWADAPSEAYTAAEEA